ncbi:uncharacterized protein OCT59_010668 [Rhizophagus irregularis]|uniref:uncharacterized protein n=1 Tax=Rhizophagus irregularis TaxID=588596 RepID=UPI0033195ACA|nr:hypothetical protein OCT59_010668 [Rhizophagus irregularis]
MDTSKQNSDTTKTDAKNLWKKCDVGYQFHATIFSTDSTTESDETISYFKKVNIMDLEKEKKYTEVGFSKIYSADWPEGKIGGWDIENQEWIRTSRKVALKSLINSSNNISNDFLNEIKYYISGHFHFLNTILCFGITQDPNTKDYMMVLQYCEGGILRNTLVEGLKLETKIEYLFHIIDGLSGFRPKISEDTPKLIVDLIIKCWDAKAENRPTAKELHQILGIVDVDDKSSEIYSQIKECEKIKENKLRNRTNENKSKNLQTHPQAIY